MTTERDAVFVKSTPLPDAKEEVAVNGYNFDEKVTIENLVDSYLTTGFQATAIGQAILEINRMLDWRHPEDGRSATIFLGYTSNLVSSGLRDIFRYLTKHNLVNVIVTSAGGIEEDFIKCIAPTFLGSFDAAGSNLRSHGMNRIGNLFIPNDNYCRFEDWLIPILDKMAEEKEIWTPSELIHRLGLEINNEESIYYWAAKHNIPVFCPALTDGSLGDILYFHSFRAKNPLVIDILADLRKLNSLAVFAPASGVIILGGGVTKHHILNANLMRNGADFAVFVNTAGEFDGSDSGAKPDEAISWGKIKATAKPVKVYCDATVAFPLIVSATFYKRVAQK
jgi:deoxyhypusine synthase